MNPNPIDDTFIVVNKVFRKASILNIIVELNPSV